MQYGRRRRHTGSPCRSMGVSHRTRWNGIHSARPCDVADYQRGSSERARIRAHDTTGPERPASSFSSLSGHWSSSFEQIGRGRLGGSNRSQSSRQSYAANHARPGHVPPFDASRGNSVARQRLAINISGEDSVAGRFWWHCARRRRPLGPHRQKHCGYKHGSEQSRVEPRGFIVR